MTDIRSRSLVTHNLLKAYQKPQVVETEKESGFGELLKTQMQTVNRAQTEASQRVVGALTHQETDLHRVMSAQQEASITFELLLEVRNKLVESFQQIMQMQV